MCSALSGAKTGTFHHKASRRHAVSGARASASSSHKKASTLYHYCFHRICGCRLTDVLLIAQTYNIYHHRRLSYQRQLHENAAVAHNNPRFVANSGVLSTYANTLLLSRLHPTDCFHTLYRHLIKPVSQSGKAFSAPQNRLCHTTTTPFLQCRKGSSVPRQCFS